MSEQVSTEGIIILFSPFRIIFPKVFPHFCTKNLIVMSLEKKTNINFYEFKNQKLRKKFVYDCVFIYCKMIFQDGFFHADPHPGNIFVGKGETPLFLDFGMVGELSLETKDDLYSFLEALASYNIEKILVKIKPLTKIKKDSDEKIFDNIIKSILGKWINSQDKSQFNIIGVITETIIKSSENGFLFKPEIVLFAKALFNLEGIGKSIYPQLDIEKPLIEFITKEEKKRFNPINISKNVLSGLKDNSDVFVNFSKYFSKYVEKFKKGNMEIKLDRGELNEIEKTMVSNNNKNMKILIFSAFLIAGTLIIEKNITIFSLNLSYFFFFLSFIFLSSYFKASNLFK